jgi:hypothetical protein
MPNLYRTLDGKERKPGTLLPFQLPDGTLVEAVWAGSAMEEKLNWWLGKEGNQIAQSEEISAIAVRSDDAGIIIWGEAPSYARLIFLLEAPATGKNYRLAKMVTIAANQAQIAYFRHERFSLFGRLQSDGTILKIPSLIPPAPESPLQGELF